MATILEYVRGNASLKTMAELIERGGMAELLNGAERYTLFAPDESAFARMDVGKMLEDPQNLQATLRYHLVAGNLSAAEIGGMGTLLTEYGKSLTIEPEEGEPLIDNAKFVARDIQCSNGMVHVIDNVFQYRLSGWYREDLS